MKNLTELTASWEVISGWKVAPEGCGFMAAGHRIKVGNYATIGDDATIGNYATICNLATIGRGATIGNGATIGDYTTIGNGATIGDYTTIGYNATIGDFATNLQELGRADGYNIIIASINGIAYISGGCRWLTLTDALAHVSDKEGYEQRRDAMEYAKIVANRNGWAF
jgi:carbonic anhydrase/acetyltransferase-like protein (isoleucine patch superfamily)